MDAATQTTAPPASYSLAAIPEPYRILGLRLRPFSLGHYLLLQRFGCKFIEAGAQPTRDDLTLGVLICSMRFVEFLEFIEQKDFLREVRAWGKRIGWYDLKEKAGLFAAYLQASLTDPDYIELNPGDSGGDWVQNLKTTLVMRCGYTAVAVLDEPLSQCLADYYKLAETEGAIRLISPEEKTAAIANAKALADFEKRRAAAKQSTLNSKPSTPEGTCPA